MWGCAGNDNQNLGPRERLPIDTGEIFKKIAVLAKLDAADFPAGNDETVHMNRIGRRRSHDHVAGTDDGQSEVREAFLRSDRDDRFGLRVEIDIIVSLVPPANGVPKLGDPT